MKVRELIKLLEEFSPNMEVYRTEGEGVVPIKDVDTYGITEPKYKLVIEVM